MFNEEEFDLIIASIAFLFAAEVPKEPVPITSDQLSSILRPPLAIGQAGDGLTSISSNRDQIEIQFGVNKLDVRDLTGDIEKARDKVPRIMQAFLALLDEPREFRSFGLNLIGEFSTNDPNAWLASNFLNPDLDGTFDMNFSTDAVSLIAERLPKEWTIRFQARKGDTINVNFNASEFSGELPDQRQLEGELAEQFAALTDFLAKLR